MCYFIMWLNYSINQGKSSAKFLSLVVITALCHCISAASRPECSRPLGMEDKRIKDWQLSSYSSDTGYYANNARLNNNRAWCSDSEKQWTEYLQIRLDRVRHISGIATQGYASRFFGTYWVFRYSIKYSYDGRVWYWYKDNMSAIIKDFVANKDATTVKKVVLRDTFVTKYLRIYPTSFKDDMCMRVELYGCSNDKDCTFMLNKPSGVISSPNYPFPYTMGIDCTWIIKLSDTSKKVTMFFKYFDVNNGTSKGCQGDFVKAINGILDTSPSLGRVCNGVHIPIFKSTENYLRLHFHSDKSNSARKGFQASFYSGDVLTATACSGSTVSLDCSSSSKSINVLHAMYGILPFSSKCGNPVSSKPCIASDTLQKVMTMCEYYKVCKVSTFHSSLSCQAGQLPYMEVYYQCSGNVIKNTTPYISTIKPTFATTTSHPAVINTGTTANKGSEPPGQNGGDTLASVKENNNTGMVVGIVVGLLALIVIVVVVLVCFLYRRSKKQNEKPTAGVTYTAPRNSLSVAPSRSGRSQTNAYETVNVLYVSADDPTLKEPEHIYDSPEFQEPLPKMTDNPLYHAFDNKDPAYENVDKPKVPSSLHPAIYDKPKTNEKTTAATSISNPNYGKSIEVISEK
ncbi:uncharacterized protein LOC110238092 isoform X2 [Exaiptasia diaphana]|uniref:Uncharacterized protein n=1 Tax=Exaiptasia diaphana TaxID=2652724 RepID=A0A913X602_EXADI|nr:uncharacterized protein LOC110238092 isoform X2 [Exaiptasia diaphana]